MAEYELAVGIETHVQLKTKSKLFCSCSNDARGAKPNSLVCPICMGMPGVLPVLNKGAVELAIRLGLALNATVAKHTKFDRKNYFYPDLPKGYQISQFDQPITYDGYVKLPSNGKKVGIIRAHLEEDAGKLVHHGDYSLVDLNRAGTPLMEIVSRPDISSSGEAKEYVQEIYNIVRYADISDADLFEGNMRFDVNVSLRKKGAKELGTRAEIKNLNSFRAVERAVQYEMKRQSELLDKGEKIVQETRGWDEAKGKTVAQRTKEEEHDYRYFPEPDLPPLQITQAMINEVKKAMPLLPAEIRRSLIKKGVEAGRVETLLSDPAQTRLILDLKANAKQVVGVVNYLTGRVRSYQGEHPGMTIKLDGARLLELYDLQSSGKVSSSAADEILAEMLAHGGVSAEAIAKKKNLLQVSDSGAIEKIVVQVIKANQKAATDYQNGNEKSMQFLVGQVMQHSKNQANPQLARQLLEKRLK